MKSIYIMSIEPRSGKTAFCLAIGKRLIEAGYRVSYFKPISTQPWYDGQHISDEDSSFVKQVLGIAQPSWELTIAVITPEYLREHLRQPKTLDIDTRINDICNRESKEYDVLLIEGASSLREGYVIGLPSQVFAQKYHCSIVALLQYHNDIQIIDDALAANTRLAPSLRGLIINRAPEDSLTFLKEQALPYLEKKDIPVFGILPERRSLAALTVGEIASELSAQILTKTFNESALVENLTVGAMTAEAALSRFRKQLNKAVITGGDRTDIQLAALETSTTCLILTGNLHPSPLIVKQAEEFGIPILLVPSNTIETIEIIEHAFGKSRLSQPKKLKEFEELVKTNLDYSRLFAAFGIS